jgi:hypothetical protein
VRAAREAALALGVDAAEFDRIVDPKTMVRDSHRDLRSKEQRDPWAPS